MISSASLKLTFLMSVMSLSMARLIDGITRSLVSAIPFCDANSNIFATCVRVIFSVVSGVWETGCFVNTFFVLHSYHLLGHLQLGQ